MDPYKAPLPDFNPVCSAELNQMLAQQQHTPESARTSHTPLSTLGASSHHSRSSHPVAAVADTEDEEDFPHGKKRRRRNRRVKGCNCKRSKCLKLYCECYAKQVFCGVDCKCVECNNMDLPQFEDARSNAIQSSLDRNSSAFFRAPVAPLAGLSRKGCKCKRSQCMKNYCECYQAGKGCIDSCRCVDCANEHGVKPPKSKRRKPDPFAHFVHPTAHSALSTLVKTEPQHLEEVAHEIAVKREIEQTIALPQKTDNESQTFTQYIQSQLQTVSQQKQMYEQMLSKHIQRLEQKEHALKDMLKTAAAAQGVEAVDKLASGSSKEQAFQTELRRLFTEFEESDLEKKNSESTPSSPHSTFSRASSSAYPESGVSEVSDHETCSDSDYEIEEPETNRTWPAAGQKWPDAVKLTQQAQQNWTRSAKPEVRPQLPQAWQPQSNVLSLDNHLLQELPLPILRNISMDLLPNGISRSISTDSNQSAWATMCIGA